MNIPLVSNGRDRVFRKVVGLKNYESCYYWSPGIPKIIIVRRYAWEGGSNRGGACYLKRRRLKQKWILHISLGSFLVKAFADHCVAEQPWLQQKEGGRLVAREVLRENEQVANLSSLLHYVQVQGKVHVEKEPRWHRTRMRRTTIG